MYGGIGGVDGRGTSGENLVTPPITVYLRAICVAKNALMFG
jgi:hypothetical protein